MTDSYKKNDLIVNFSSKTKPFIIAELSANHNGSIERAFESIKAAKEAGADEVKIQTYTADTMTIPCDNDVLSYQYSCSIVNFDNEGFWKKNDKFVQ